MIRTILDAMTALGETETILFQKQPRERTRRGRLPRRWCRTKSVTTERTGRNMLVSPEHGSESGYIGLIACGKFEPRMIANSITFCWC